MANTQNKAPVAKLQVKTVQASIWERSTEKGKFFDVSFQRGYKTAEGWKNTRASTSKVFWPCSTP